LKSALTLPAPSVTASSADMKMAIAERHVLGMIGSDASTDSSGLISL